MQNFDQYLKDIHFAENPELLDDDIEDDYDRWSSSMDIETCIQYADDYAKDCLRQAKELIQKGIQAKMTDTQEDTGSFKYDVVYEECRDVVNDIIK